MSSPGPAALGRGVVIARGQPVPAPWQGSPVVLVDDAAVAGPANVVRELHRAWASRVPVVVELAVDPAVFREPPSFTDAPWRLGPDHELWLDRLHFLVWANTYDARADAVTPVWWWARKAARLHGVSPLEPDEAGDVRLRDGSVAWVDGGPRASFSPSELLGLGLVHRESVEVGTVALVPTPVAPTADLAPDQLVAVGHGSGPARIIAPAGSGKTRVLTERLRHLLVDRG
jgi:DNA helicase II / ATP-dependent DNA helicase PcrA